MLIGGRGGRERQGRGHQVAVIAEAWHVGARLDVAAVWFKTLPAMGPGWDRLLMTWACALSLWQTLVRW